MEAGHNIFLLGPSVHLTPFTQSLLPGVYCYCFLLHVLVQCTNEGKARAATLLPPRTSLRSSLSWLVLGFCTRRKESRSSSLSPPRSGWNTTTHTRENTEGGMFGTASEVTRYSLEGCRRGERGGRREGEERERGKEEKGRERGEGEGLED